MSNSQERWHKRVALGISAVVLYCVFNGITGLVEVPLIRPALGVLHVEMLEFADTLPACIRADLSYAVDMLFYYIHFLPSFWVAFVLLAQLQAFGARIRGGGSMGVSVLLASVSFLVIGIAYRLLARRLGHFDLVCQGWFGLVTSQNCGEPAFRMVLLGTLNATIDVPVMGGALLLTWAVRRGMRNQKLGEACGNCGYLIQGRSSDNCPECGKKWT